jgi:hypothetical protein
MPPMDSNSVQRSQSAEALRAWIAGMNDAELLRFGQGAAHMCTPAKNSNRPIREVFREPTPSSFGCMNIARQNQFAVGEDI